MHSRGGGRGQGVFWPSSTPKIIAALRSKYDNKIFLLFLDEDEELSEHSDESVCVYSRDRLCPNVVRSGDNFEKERKETASSYPGTVRVRSPDTVQEWMIFQQFGNCN
jgi:hypothetical protein